MFTMTEKSLLPEVARSLDAARALQARGQRSRSAGSWRRRGALLDGDWNGGCLALDHVLVDHPRDALALQVGHLMDFYRGDAQNLRNRVSRVLPHWDESVPGFSYVLGMHAFGLEEMNQYAEAEAAARRALVARAQGRLGRARGRRT